MNNKRYIKTCSVILTAVAICLVGCTPFPGKDRYYGVSVPQEKLHHIEALDLQQTDNPAPSQPDVNQPAPKDQVELTLEQCRAAALENNLDLKVQLISPAIAAQRVSEEEAHFEAAFFSNFNYRKTDTPIATTLDISGSNVDYARTDLGVQVPLRTGGTVTFDLADSRTKSNSIYSYPNPSYSSNMSVSISQPLLRNAGRRVNEYAIRLAEYDRQITDSRTKLEVIRVVAALDRVYWRLYAARRELEVRRQEFELAHAQLLSAQRFVRAGQRAQVEVVRAEAGVAERLESIILAENNLRDRERELKLALNKAGLEMNTPTVVIPLTDPDPVRYELERGRLVELALENRMEMLELELQIAQDIATIDYSHNQTLPLVTLDYTYNVNGLGPTRADSFDLLREKRFEDHSFGVELLVPLGNEAARSRLYQAFYQRIQRLATRKNRKALIEQEVLDAVDQIEANWQRVLASRQRAILDSRLYQAERRQFEVGMNTTTDVLQAQTQFADAQSAEILALAEYQIAFIDLAYATGTLLGAAKVQWTPIIPEARAD